MTRIRGAGPQSTTSHPLSISLQWVFDEYDACLPNISVHRRRNMSRYNSVLASALVFKQALKGNLKIAEKCDVEDDRRTMSPHEWGDESENGFLEWTPNNQSPLSRDSVQVLDIFRLWECYLPNVFGPSLRPLVLDASHKGVHLALTRRCQRCLSAR